MTCQLCGDHSSFNYCDECQDFIERHPSVDNNGIVCTDCHSTQVPYKAFRCINTKCKTGCGKMTGHNFSISGTCVFCEETSATR